MIELDSKLLSVDATVGSNVVLRATDKAHGLYSTQQFVLRLSREIHNILGSVSPGLTYAGRIGFDGVQAMSTYLHETIHWWQHIGTTFGFVYGLNYPVQSHVAYNDLVKFIERDGFKKSIYKRLLELGPKASDGPDSIAGIGNRIVNNHFDLIAFRAVSLGPKHAKMVVAKGQFESVGHSFHITYGHTLNILGSTIDPGFTTILDPRQWDERFQDLETRKVSGFFYGSPVHLWPLGIHEIFEGQARFSQIQYLSHASGHTFTWANFREIGMLSGVYVKAFDEFLRLSESDWPDDVNDPLIALFLVVCDLSLNPSVAFPRQVPAQLESFVDEVNPGARFCFFSRLIARNPSMKKSITKFDRADYESITFDLCIALGEPPPMDITQTFSEWFDKAGPFGFLRREYEEYDFSPTNFVIRHLFSHFLAFQQDKSLRPEFFCWPGAWMAGERSSTKEQILFERHGALFIDKECDDGVFPRLQPERDETTVHQVFDKFYHSSVVYDLINQWISSPGPFKFDIGWLAAGASPNVTSDFLRRQFMSVFGVDPIDAHIVA